MKKSIKQLTIGLSIAVMAFTGLAAFSPAGSSGILGAQKASASYCVTKWYVVWPVAGIYSGPNIYSNIIGHVYQNQAIYSPAPSETYSGWITVVSYSPTTGYIRKAALNYQGTTCY